MISAENRPAIDDGQLAVEFLVSSLDGLAVFAELVLKRKLSFPLSRMWQWWVSRSSNAVVISASPKTADHSLKLRLVVMTTLVRSKRLARAGGRMVEEAGVTPPWFSRIVRLGFLSPGIVTAIVDGTQPLELSADRLLKSGPISSVWSEQPSTYGFV